MVLRLCLQKPWTRFFLSSPFAFYSSYGKRFAVFLVMQHYHVITIQPFEWLLWQLLMLLASNQLVCLDLYQVYLQKKDKCMWPLNLFMSQSTETSWLEMQSCPPYTFARCFCGLCPRSLILLIGTLSSQDGNAKEDFD